MFNTWEAKELGLMYSSTLACFFLAESTALLPHGLVWLMRGGILFLAAFTVWTYQEWEKDFALRPGRESQDCPSHYRRPDTGNKVGAKWDTPSTVCEPVDGGSGNGGGCRRRVRIAPNADSGHCWKPPSAVPGESGSSFRMVHRQGTSLDDLEPHSEFARRRTSHLDPAIRAENPHMDHLPLSFSDYLWCNFFVLPPAILHFIIGGANTTGLLGMVWRRLAQRCGDFSEEQAAHMGANYMLEIASLAIWCDGVREGKATFSIPNVSRVVSSDPAEVISDTLTVVVDLPSRLVVEAAHGETHLGPHDVLALIFNAMGGSLHAVPHSYANWGLNTAEATHWFVRRMSVITIKYNNIGVESFPLVCDMFRSAGFTKHTSKDAVRLTCYFNHNVPSHKYGSCRGKALQQLRPHSATVRFIFHMHNFFVKRFESHKHDFPGIDGTALFVGTVMHALDHRNAGYYGDNRAFSAPHPAKDASFAADHEWADFTLACATDRPPGRLFSCSFEHAPHPFYREVFAHAKRENPRLAGYMEACIGM